MPVLKDKSLGCSTENGFDLKYGGLQIVFLWNTLAHGFSW